MFGGCVRAAECRWWKLFLWQLVMVFKDFGTTFVYVVVRRFDFDFDVCFVFGVFFY